MYASVWCNRRRLLWDFFRQDLSNAPASWAVIGDFNAALGAHEKSGPPPASRPCADFRSFIDDCNLSQVGTHGAFFTWSKGGASHPRTECKLDRALCTMDFLSFWS